MYIFSQSYRYFAWRRTTEALDIYFEGTLARHLEVQTTPVPHTPLLSRVEDSRPPLAVMYCPGGGLRP